MSYQTYQLSTSNDVHKAFSLPPYTLIC